MDYKALSAISMVVVAILLAILGFSVMYNDGLFHLGNGYLTAIILLIASGVVGFFGILLGLIRFVKWGIKD